MNNIFLPSHYPIQELAHLMRIVFVLLVTLFDKEIFAVTYSIKTQAYMASSRLILATINGEKAKIIEELQAVIEFAKDDLH